ncbi:ATP-binding protein [Streptosporangium canum]|uniref:ATP-binding protein n=1 Tax=Streptosporangium canum TaxID=324952 RepID=UPI0034365764
MTSNPLFQEPIPSPSQSEGKPRADIIQIDTALESMRDSGFDLTAAAGEPIDNSVESGATRIQVLTKVGEKKRSIDEIAFIDNGRGINPNILAHVLSMGFSTRYGQRGGLGRFGVGLKLAGLSLGRRIDVYTKQAGDDTIRHAYIDLQEIAAKKQTHIEAQVVEGWPPEYDHAMRESGEEALDSGTLVVYGKIDRLIAGSHYGTSLDEKLSDLRSFIARAYRKFLDQGLVIELNGTRVTLLDPLFRMDNPRIMSRYASEDPRGTIVDEGDIEIADGHSIHVTVTLVPVQFRWEGGLGGSKDHNGRDIREYQIAAERAGKISMMRNGREINYDIVPRLLPTGIDKIDRYIGIEVAFPAELDEFFQVRNVKRGAVPVAKLREKLREWLDRPVRAARRQIRAHWGEVATQKHATTQEHQDTIDAAARAEKTAPMGQAGKHLTDEQSEELLQELFDDLGIKGDEEKTEQVREQVESKPFTLVDAGWPGKEIFEITHLNGKAIVRLNHRHPFIRDIYDPLKTVAKNGSNGLDLEELVNLARKTEKALDLLFLAYAKAENMHRDPEQFDDLRSYWGQFTQAYLKEIAREEES